MQQLISWFWRKMSALKQTMVGSSVRVFTLILFGAATAVWLTLSPSARVQASDLSDLEETYPYIYWLRDYNVLVVSKKLPVGKTFGTSNGTTTTNKIMPYPYQTWFESTTKDVLYAMTINNYSRGDAFCLIYNPITGWECEYPAFITNNAVSTTPTSYSVAVYIAETKNRYTFSNGVSIPSGFYNSGTTLPDTIPSIDTVSDAINNALNATTQVTTQAVTINNNINNTYNTYQSGGITQAEFNEAMEEYRTQLEALSNNSNATLADQMAVNNALTNLDITINQQVNNVSPALMTLLNDIRSQISGFFNSYSNGNSTQSVAVNNIKNTINENLLKVTSQYTSTADRTAINGTVEYANQLINAIGSFSDLDSNISESVQTSDSEELEYLDSAIAETRKDISDLKSDLDDVISDSDAQLIKTNVLEPILDNLLVKSLLPIAALFMVLAVTLGVRYRL